MASTHCFKDKPDDILSIIKTPYTGNNLKMNGYYYIIGKGGIGSIYFFYDNGELISVDGGENTLESTDNYIIANFINDQYSLAS